MLIAPAVAADTAALVNLAGNKTRIAAASPDPPLALRRSLRPRSLDAIRRQIAAPG